MCSLYEDQVCLITSNITAGQTRVSDRIGQDNVGGRATCHHGAVYIHPHASALCMCLNLLCGNQCSVQPDVTTHAECRRYNVHAELLRQKNKYGKKGGKGVCWRSGERQRGDARQVNHPVSET